MSERKVAVITGGGRGIGRAISIQLAKEGYDIVINYAGNEQSAIDTKNEIELRYPYTEVLILKADVSKSDEVECMFKETIEHLGRIDVLVNNAGITRDNLVIRMKEEDWDSVIHTNLKGVFLCSQKASRTMIKQKSGTIINISSIVGRIGNSGQANYVAAKSGVIGLTKTMARELSSRGIRVNAIAPGFIETDMTDKLSEEMKNELLMQIPLGFLGKPDDIAHAVSFLVNDKAMYITGQVLSVDGGMYM